MKIALLMTGQCRQLWLTAPSIYKNVIDPNNADVFLYLNKDSLVPSVDNTQEIVKRSFPRNVKSLVFTDDDYDRELQKLIASNYSKIDGFYKKLNRENWDKQLNNHNTDQYLKLKMCCQEAVYYANKNNFKYDLILRCRPDIGWLNKFDLLRPLAADTLYCNQSSHRVVDSYYDWIEDTCFFGGQDVMSRICSDFSDKMVDVLEICDEKHDLTCATEKLLARCILNTGVKLAGINEYFNYEGPGWIRPKLSKYWVDWKKSINFPLIESFYGNGPTEHHAVYFDRISEENVVMDSAIVIK